MRSHWTRSAFPQRPTALCSITLIKSAGGFSWVRRHQSSSQSARPPRKAMGRTDHVTDAAGSVASAPAAPFVRADGIDKVSGLGLYTADVALPGMASARLLYA